MDIFAMITAFAISFVVSLIATPLVRQLAFKLNAVDKPDENRKKHKEVKPSMGGLAIFIGAAAGLIYLQPHHPQMYAIILGALFIAITGMLDDIMELKPIYKLFGQLAAAITVVSSGLIIEKLTLPFFGQVELGYFGIIITVIWIVGASNAINLIDGLDGLAAGVSTIALSSILVMAIIDYRITVIYLCIILIGGCLGFLPFNFYPAKIFMGDTGALFLGYAIAIVSMLGLFKNVAFFSFIIPIMVLAIPIFDTTAAIIRRAVNHQGIATADHNHIHYQLMKKGYSHRGSVLIIYGFSLFFGAMAIIFNSGTLLSSLVIFAIVIFGIHIVADVSGMTLHEQTQNSLMRHSRKANANDKTKHYKKLPSNK